MYDVDHPAYKKLTQIGREITTKVKPRAVVVFSAHWQGGRDTIYVNTAEQTDLIYEYVLAAYYGWKVANVVVQLLRFPGSLLQGKVPERGQQGSVTQGARCAEGSRYRGKGCQAWPGSRCMGEFQVR